jgi:two-component system sensor histidine kinase MtrB
VHEETVALDQLKLNFVAVASHELRTPATAVYGALATIMAREGLDPEIRDELLRTAYEQSDRLRLLLEQLLDLSRLDDASVAVQPRPVALHAALCEIAEHVVHDESKVELHVDQGLAANVDPIVLDRVVTNLLTNAMRYGAAPYILGAEQNDRHLRVSVEDNGGGVPEPLVPYLFDRFTRGQDARGTGLGLAIARAYARAHGGDLLYERRDRGARFELVVPQAEVTRPVSTS